jgi:hypothetical protein
MRDREVGRERECEKERQKEIMTVLVTLRGLLQGRRR